MLHEDDKGLLREKNTEKDFLKIYRFLLNELGPRFKLQEGTIHLAFEYLRIGLDISFKEK